MYKHFHNYNWNKVLAMDDADQATEEFTKVVKDAIHFCAEAHFMDSYLP